jgi:endonuclease G, mitochondrial
MAEPILPTTQPVLSTGTTALSAVQMNFSGSVTINIAATPVAPALVVTASADALPGQEAAIRFDPDYDNRTDYDPDFLGTPVPPPHTSAGRLPEMLKEGARELVLPYHNYSLAMNRDRRLQMWSAVNVDYSESARRWFGERDSFGSDKWIPDPRIPAKYQIMDAEAYEPSRSLQRGHMVRRDDAASRGQRRFRPPAWQSILMLSCGRALTFRGYRRTFCSN